MELFNIITRLTFGATISLAVVALLSEQLLNYLS